MKNIFRAEKEKQKQQEQQQKPKPLPLPIQQEKPVDPAILAELEAQREREKVCLDSIIENKILYSKIPLEERINQFRQLLEDKKVSATSTWEKELSKVFNYNYTKCNRYKQILIN